MKRLIEHINESLIIRSAINYGVVGDIYMYLKYNSDFEDRIQAICDKYRHDFSENFTTDIILSSVIFNKLIDDLIKEYKEEIRPIEVNFASLEYLKSLIATEMVDKIKTELDYPQMNLMGDEI